MAAIDSLLRLIAAQKADALRLTPDAVPVLLIGEGERPLSMPPVAASMLTAFLEEIADPDASAPADGDQGFVHRGGGDEFDVAVSRASGTIQEVLFRPVGGGGASDPTASPVPAATPVSFAAPPGSEPAPTSAPAPAKASPRPPVSAAALVRLLHAAVDKGASDLFLSAGIPATWRVDGQILPAGETVPTDAELESLFLSRLSDAQRQRFDALGGVDLAYELPAATGGGRHRFRVSLFRQELGLAAALRPVSRRIPSLEELHLPAAVSQLTEHRHGLVLMTGPTGSGKSTTLAALIGQLHRTRTRHVITIEDPIEFRYPPGRCLIHQREVGTHVASFADGVRSALRSAPDVILVGEMRDPETIAATLTAAETGHLVLSTLHCGAVGMAVDRIIDAFPQARQRQVRLQLADVLRSVVGQRLLVGTRGGRVPAVEVLQVTHAVSALIRESRGHHIQTQIQTGRDSGMVPLERSLADLVRAGLVTRATALQEADDPQVLLHLLA